MPDPRHVAVIDIGKTNAKLVLHDLADGADLFVATEPNRVRTDGPYPHHDIDRLWAFLMESLATMAARHPIDAFSVTTHGASITLIDDQGLALPMLDYESPLPDEISDAYAEVRPLFAETYSPDLPGGLNPGRQLFWLQHRFPERFATARWILCYPQYWAWRLTGTVANELTSLGCHTDLWAPGLGDYSALVDRVGWRSRLPPIRSAFDTFGPLRQEIAGRVGLTGRAIPVHGGIHDSNASLLPHLLARPAPLSVVSSGTWLILFAVGGSLAALDPGRDMLANVDAFGRPVPSARFMGGREFDLLTDGAPTAPTTAELVHVLERQVMVLPTFSPGTGPYPDAKGRWTTDPAPLSPGERTAAASLYTALVTARMLDGMQAGGTTIVEGPFARNQLYLDMLATATERPVIASASATGTAAGAAMLVLPKDRRPEPIPPAATGRPDPRLADYARAWLALVEPA